MGLLEPTRIPGFDRLVVELILIFAAIIGSILFVTISSIVGILRAVRRRRRGGRSIGAIVSAGAAMALMTAWLLYWVSDDISHQSTPLDGMLAINLSLCGLPFAWLIVAIRANAACHETKKQRE